METAIFALGCFWCSEAVFKRLKGVSSVTSGYTGGENENPNYENIGSHAEAVKIEFDPKIITYQTLLDVFFHLHDPTQLNRQGADVGEQYRSEIFYLDVEQKRQAEKALEVAQEEYDGKVVTKLSKAGEFYKAEDYHQDYYDNNKNASYCKAVIDPKITKLFDKYSDLTA